MNENTIILLQCRGNQPTANVLPVARKVPVCDTLFAVKSKCIAIKLGFTINAPSETLIYLIVFKQ